MKSKTSQEGYLLIDNRANGGGAFEAATLTCSHCQKQVIRNPARERARAYCPKCDHYICDDCELARVQTGICVPFTQVMDIIDTKIAHGENVDNPQSLIARLSKGENING